MDALANPAVSFVVVIIIGAAAGWILEQVMRTSWLSKQIAGPGRVLLTSALVGIAGSFIGYNLAILLIHARGGSIVPFVGAILGAALILFAWRTIRL